MAFNGLSGGSDGKESACNAGDLGLISESEDYLEKEMATHSRILAWRIICTEEPGRLQSMGLQRIRHNWVSDQYFHFHDIQSSLQFDPNLQTPPPLSHPPQQKHAPPCTHHLHSTTKVSWHFPNTPMSFHTLRWVPVHPSPLFLEYHSFFFLLGKTLFIFLKGLVDIFPYLWRLS